jgi:hypothetical protein
VNLPVVEESHGNPFRHGISVPLQVHLLSFPDSLEWTCEPIVRRASLFVKLFHVDVVVRLPTLQWSLHHLSSLYLVVVVPLLLFLDNLNITLNVMWIWFALLHLFKRSSSRQTPTPSSGGQTLTTSN